MEERLKLFLAMEGLSPSQFADKLGIQRSGVSHLLSGRNKPSFEFINKMLLTFPKINPDWLITGTGKAYRGFSAEADQATDYVQDAAQAVAEPFEESIQESPVNNQEPELFGEQQNEPKTVTIKTSAEPKPAAADRVFTPAQGKRIAQITILYTDGTYELR